MDIVDVGAALALAKKQAISAVPGAVSDWLNNHPEATTTVQDGAITKAKLEATLKSEIETNTSDVSDLKSALNAMGLCVYNGQFYVNPNGNSTCAA